LAFAVNCPERKRLSKPDFAIRHRRTFYYVFLVRDGKRLSQKTACPAGNDGFYQLCQKFLEMAENA